MNPYETGVERLIAEFGIPLGEAAKRTIISNNLSNLSAINIPELTVLEKDSSIIDCWHFLFPQLSLPDIHKLIDQYATATFNPKPGDIVVYFKKELMHPWQKTHGARVIYPRLLTSKWGEGNTYICQHTLDLVPISYGSIAIYLSLPSGLK